MITCDQCGKVEGHNLVGTSWICEDCRIGSNGGTDFNEVLNDKDLTEPKDTHQE
jgi:ribosomal protein L37AE/L43A